MRTFRAPQTHKVRRRIVIIEKQSLLYNFSRVLRKKVWGNLKKILKFEFSKFYSMQKVHMLPYYYLMYLLVIIF